MKEPAIPRALRNEPPGALRARRDIRVRLFGTGLLVASLFLVWRLHAIVTASPRHEPTLVELLMSLGIVLTGLAGA